MFYTILALHVLGATIWTGGHLVLAFTVLPRALRARDPAILQDFEQGYERIGIPALLVQLPPGSGWPGRWCPTPVTGCASPIPPRRRWG